MLLKGTMSEEKKDLRGINPLGRYNTKRTEKEEPKNRILLNRPLQVVESQDSSPATPGFALGLSWS